MSNVRPLKQVEEMEETTQSDSVFSIENFVLNGNSQEMRKKMKEQKFVLGRLAAEGQSTVFYGGPNTGKTLLTMHQLIEAIEHDNVKADRVFYINADDHYRGLTEKLELAERHGFNMLAPSYKGFKSEMLKPLLEQLIQSDQARGAILILDTLKKFTDQMDKRKASEFGSYSREFISQGGTLILLSHVNKHKDSSGKSVHAGTTDILEDVDCSYILDATEGEGSTKMVVFENNKMRGDMAKTQAFQYSTQEGQNYQDLLSSVCSINSRDLSESRKKQSRGEQAAAFRELINETIACITGGISKKTELVSEVHNRTSISKRKVTQCLSMFSGANREEHQYWTSKTEKHNAQIYQLNPQTRELGARV